MKLKAIQTLALGVIAGLSLSSAALAGGKHASGHGHEGEDIGKPGVAAKVTRTVTVDMVDAMRFTPEKLSVKQGETVRFVVKNSGKVKHEFVLGTEAEHKRHYAQMMKFPEMEHADPNMVTVAPGQSGEVIWQFITRPA
jgi:uncharacterized cupredoxin-like copper-binding protein